MPVLRFPNPAAFLERIIQTYGQIYAATNHLSEFTLDEATKVLVMSGQGSSSGATGSEAMRRSRKTDRTKDPLFNQLKMYSELHRMLGWYRPASSRSSFSHTLLGSYIAEEDIQDPNTQSLVRECFVGIVHPNINVTSRTSKNNRYFPLLLEFIDRLGGYATMNEIVLGVHTIDDDRDSEALGKRVELIQHIRENGALAGMRSEFAKLAESEGKGTDTIGNYTRIPLGVCKSRYVNWAVPQKKKGPYDRKTTFYALTENGKTQLSDFKCGRDIRANDTNRLTEEDCAFLTNYSFYGMLRRCGYPVADQTNILTQALPDFPDVESLLDAVPPHRVYYSPFQLAKTEIIDRATHMFDEIERKYGEKNSK